MDLIDCAIPGPLIIEPRVFEDGRGFFFESWNAASFRAAGLDITFVQDNHSQSSRGVLRGLHFQHPNAQGKLVRVTRGAVWDVIVDIRPGSAYFGQWIGMELSARNRRLLWIPEGFAHGFLTLEDQTDLLYKCTRHYVPAEEFVIAWDDPALGIAWPLADLGPQLSTKDRAGLPFAGIEALL